MHNAHIGMSTFLHLRPVRIAFLLLASAMLVAGLQYFLGAQTIYHAQLREKRSDVHERIVANQPPEGGWTSIGQNGTNIRIGTVYLAEALRRVSGVPVHIAYRVMDTVALFAALPLLFVLLRRCVNPEYALIGMLYFAAVLPLTYFLHYYHPWDRAALVSWILLLLAIALDRPLLLAVTLVAAIVIKYDAVLVPGLYFLVRARRETLWPVGRITAGLFAMSFGTYYGLRAWLPGGFAPSDPVNQVMLNLADIRTYHVFYPPLLMFLVPVLLVLFGWRSADRFARACAVFGALIAGVLFIGSMFAEVRAQLPILLLLLPGALVGLRDLTRTSRPYDSGERLSPPDSMRPLPVAPAER